MGDVEKLREDEEMEEGEASESDEDVEVNVTLPTEKNFHNNNNGIPYGPDPVTKHSFFSGFTTDAKEKPCELDEPSSMHSPSSLSVKLLYKSLDLGHDDFQEGYWKSDTLHMWSAESVDAAAIMYYFRNFGPSSIHWTSHNECNVHWKDNCGPIKALLGMSCPIQYGEDPLLPPGSHQPLSPPRPPTRRHNTPQEALGETSDKHDAQSKKKKKKMKKSESSGSSESSSSDSDDSSSSSSDSSSSDSDSSDSDSDDSSSDSDSSSSSSSSSDSDSSSSRKIKAKKRKKLAKAASKKVGEMEVDDASQKMEGPAVKTEVDVSNEASVKLSDIPAGCALPKGRWRLGLPCPQSRVLLFRFANSDDIDKAHQMKRKLHAPDDDRKGGVWSLYDEEKRQRKKRRRKESDEEEDDEMTGLRMGRDEERRRRRARRTYEAGVKARLSGPKLGLPIMRPPSAALSLYHPPRPDAFPPPLVAAAAEGVYRDLDDPGVQPEDAKNPWGSLAQNWGKKETSCLDYQALLKNHRKAATTGQKRKRDHDEDSGYDGARCNRHDGGYPRPGPDSHRRVGDHHRYPDSGGEDRQRSDEEEDGSSESDASDDVVAWNSKMRYPRMKMYADVEEKRRKVKPKRHKPITDGAQWDPRARDAAEGSPRKAKSIFSRLGGGDVPHPRTSVSKFRERELIAPADRDWGAERPVKRSRVTSSPAREVVGGMRSEVHVARARDVKSRLGGGRRY